MSTPRVAPDSSSDVAEEDLAHAIDVALAALPAVHALDAVAQRGVPAALGGVQALEPVGAGLLDG